MPKTSKGTKGYAFTVLFDALRNLVENLHDTELDVMENGEEYSDIKAAKKALRVAKKFYRS